MMLGTGELGDAGYELGGFDQNSIWFGTGGGTAGFLLKDLLKRSLLHNVRDVQYRLIRLLTLLALREDKPMNRRTILNLSGLLFASLATSFMTVPAQAADPSMTGTWELNVAKSTSTGPLPKSQTRTYEATADQEKMTGTGVDAKGNPVSVQFTAKFDGKDYPFQGPNADMIALTRIDALKSNFVLKSGGKVVLSGTRALAADGKTYTLSSKGNNAEGQPVETVLAFDRR